MVYYISELATGHLRDLAITGDEKIKFVVAVIDGCTVIGRTITCNHVLKHQATEPLDSFQTKQMLLGYFVFFLALTCFERLALLESTSYLKVKGSRGEKR